ncbi:MAG: hypothetical protein DRO73_01315 [Candidatus Thorarchaeota archaeon]|nr:MAG: hypothetical protein DRO73_01315 [Candidatus Thorarchaeota archaeon]
MESEQIRTWLELMRLPYEYDEETRTYVTTYDIEGRSVRVLISPNKPEWIKVRVRLGRIDKIPEENQLSVLREMLVQNFELDDVTFSMDDNGVLYSENDIPRSSNLENFHSEMTAVVLGSLTFVREIGPKYGLDEKDLFE